MARATIVRSFFRPRRRICTNIDGFHHFALVVADIDRSLRWYDATLGFALEARWEIDGDGVKFAHVAGHGVRFELFEVRGDPARAERRAAGAREEPVRARSGRSPGRVRAVAGRLGVIAAVAERSPDVAARPSLSTARRCGFEAKFSAFDPGLPAYRVSSAST